MTGKTDKGATTEAPKRPSVRTIFDEGRINAALRVLALKHHGGALDEEHQKRYGVNADGTQAKSGWTEEGKKLGRELAEQIDEVMAQHSRSDDDYVDKIEVPDSVAMIAALGLGGPIRAAIRAASQALAAALDDGASDDAGLGGVDEPHVILRLKQSADSPIGVVSVENGGGVRWRRDPEYDGTMPAVEHLVSMAAEGVAAAAQEAGYAPADVRHYRPGDPLPDGVPAEFVDLLRHQFGDETMDAAVANGSGSGPNTEAPYGVPDERSSDSPADPARSGDDGDTAAPLPDRGGPDGGAAPAGDQPSTGESGGSVSGGE